MVLLTRFSTSTWSQEYKEKLLGGIRELFFGEDGQERPDWCHGVIGGVCWGGGKRTQFKPEDYRHVSRLKLHSFRATGWRVNMRGQRSNLDASSIFFCNWSSFFSPSFSLQLAVEEGRVHLVFVDPTNTSWALDWVPDWGPKPRIYERLAELDVATFAWSVEGGDLRGIGQGEMPSEIELHFEHESNEAAQATFNEMLRVLDVIRAIDRWANLDGNPAAGVWSARANRITFLLDRENVSDCSPLEKDDTIQSLLGQVLTEGYKRAHGIGEFVVGGAGDQTNFAGGAVDEQAVERKAEPSSTKSTDGISREGGRASANLLGEDSESSTTLPAEDTELVSTRDLAGTGSMDDGRAGLPLVDFRLYVVVRGPGREDKKK